MAELLCCEPGADVWVCPFGLRGIFYVVVGRSLVILFIKKPPSQGIHTME